MEPQRHLLLTLLDHPSRSFLEDEIQLLWRYLVPKLETVTTSAGTRVTIRDPGRIGQTSGPDVQAVEVSIDNVNKTGDLEIHRQASDWYHHGHHRDKTFNRVILHVSLLNDDTPIRREDGRFVENVILEDYLPELKEHLREEVENSKRRRREEIRRPCYPVSRSERYRSTLRKAGDAWLNWKASRIRSLPPGDRLFVQLIESLGYSKNHQGFRRLAERISRDRFYRDIHDAQTTYELEGYALGIGGWLSESYFSERDSVNRSIYYRRTNWSQRSMSVRVDAVHNWDRSNVRPHVFPVRRWVGFVWSTRRLGTTWVEEITNQVEAVLGQGDFRSLVHEYLDELFGIPSGNYWKHHYGIDDEYHDRVSDPFGSNWYDQMIVNVLLPYFQYLGLRDGRGDLLDRVEETFRNYPPVLSNRRIRRLESQWGLTNSFDWSSVREQQGGVLLYKKGCSVGHCAQCELNDRERDNQTVLFDSRR